MSVITGARNAFVLLVGAGLVLTVVNYGHHDRSEAGKSDNGGRPRVAASTGDGNVQVTIKVASHGYPLRNKWLTVNWKLSGRGTASTGGAEPSLTNEYTKDLGRHPKGTHVQAWVVPPAGADQAIQVQGISLFFDGVRVDGPLTSAGGLPIPGTAFTAGENWAKVEKVIV